MVSVFDIYLIGIIDAVKGGLAALVCISGGAAFLCIAFGFDERPKFFFPWAKRFLIAAAILVVMCTLTPSTKTVAAMYVLPAIINSEAVQELPSELTTLAREWVQELRPKKNLKEF